MAQTRQAVSRHRISTQPITALNPQFPGRVIPLSSVPRLRPGAVCVIHSLVKCHMNNGVRVVIIEQSGEDEWLCESLDRPLVVHNDKGEIYRDRSLRSNIIGSRLYRIPAEAGPVISQRIGVL
ncbi:hypothetical protein ACLIKD_06840 [Azonexus sp. IMCC34842]|uniref:hypothetical protein n=1 Tax=Azonexus sp. IMCC34842 TaxID=3420950 RepID=UPI003D0C83E5